MTSTATIERLVAEALPGSHWEGHLSSSALSTATATCALELYRRHGTPAHADDLAARVAAGVEWLAAHQNEDGGWGDTIDSPSNSSTTTLVWVALGIDRALAARHQTALDRTTAWLKQRAGGLTPDHLSRCILASYGADRTFSVPILTMCALGGRFGEGRDAWASIPAIPFELAAVPRRWFRRLGLPMVSYALPALIAMGQVRHHQRPTRNPVTRLLRHLTRGRTLRVLQSIQPSGGGFLEAAPLTSFVSMSLIGAGLADHVVVQKAICFLLATGRDDGSWPIDTNLATWLTTLSVNALASGNRLHEHLDEPQRREILDWLLEQQYRVEHPYTDAAAGGWAWTDLSGGVPDADDTAGALLALRQLTTRRSAVRESSASIPRTAGKSDATRVAIAAAEGATWLADLQNRDGGIPTFCRGWGKLPFDHSSPDLTAHALRAWHAWRDELPQLTRRHVERAAHRAVQYLVSTQTPDGTWVPLWFGNQHDPDLHNSVYGTSRVLRARAAVGIDSPVFLPWQRAMQRGLVWLIGAQNSDGGWGGAPGVVSSIEETGVALEALAGFVASAGTIAPAEDVAPELRATIARGLAWLDESTQGGTQFACSPIGLYFAKLWYFERLYPMIFSVAATERLRGEDEPSAAAESTTSRVQR